MQDKFGHKYPSDANFAVHEAELEEEPEMSEEDKKKSKLVYSLAALQFLVGSATSQMSPFYPLKAKEKGATASYVGTVIGTFPIAQLVAAFLVGKCL